MLFIGIIVLYFGRVGSSMYVIAGLVPAIQR